MVRADSLCAWSVLFRVFTEPADGCIFYKLYIGGESLGEPETRDHHVPRLRVRRVQCFDRLCDEGSARQTALSLRCMLFICHLKRELVLFFIGSTCALFLSLLCYIFCAIFKSKSFFLQILKKVWSSKRIVKE
jgi:hypothetical protein